MKKLGIISEFNPFHNGHEYLLEKSKEETKAEIAISLMSGDYVQRGEVAIIDKFSRADCAMKAGFDMVIEMPNYITLQSAEYFALGSIKILNKLNIDYLCFGIENEEPDEFLKKSHILIDKKNELDSLTKKNLNKSSFAKARYDATVEILEDNNFITSNNILALEYIRAIEKTNSKMKTIPIKRVSSNNNDINLNSSNISSSTAIRKNIFNSYKDHVPIYSYKIIEDIKEKYGIASMNYFYDLFKFLILIEHRPMDDIIGYENGIDKYLEKIAVKNLSFDNFIKEATTRRYTSSRIKRLILNYILENKVCFNNYDINFYKPLAFNKKSENILKNASSKAIIRKKDSYNLSKTDQIIYSKIIKASNLYSLSTGSNLYEDFTKKIGAIANNE